MIIDLDGKQFIVTVPPSQPDYSGGITALMPILVGAAIFFTCMVKEVIGKLS